MADKYDLELERAIEEIKKRKAKRVCIQLPEGLRPMAKQIYEKLESETGATIFIWLGSCFGACDVPTFLKDIGFDLLIQWGHAELQKSKK